jgi:acyl-CoA synthetase (AMP-forming)/AMP-acid ligase II/alkylation response protein AidB-like acyl-CoA dehydrogenase/acyl carrier protein
MHATSRERPIALEHDNEMLLPATAVAPLTERLRSHARLTPQRVAYTFLRDDGKIDELTYGELERRASALAATLAQRAAAGSRALLLYPAGLEFITVYCACLLAGLIAVPATIPHKTRASRRLKALLDDAAPSLILTRSDCEPAVLASLSLVDAANRACLSTDTLVLAGDPALLPAIDPGMTAFVQYTSGSTSLPKGVEITHLNIASNVESIRQGFGFDPDSVMVSWLPLFHDMGLIGSVVAPLYVGFRCVLMAPAAFLKNPRMWLEAISAYRGTCAGSPNFGWDYCVKRITEDQKDGLDLSSLAVAYNGSEPIRAATLRAFSGAFARCGMRKSSLFPCYGMAETTLFVAGGPIDQEPVVRTVSKSLLEGNQIRDVAPGGPDAREIVSSGRIGAGNTVVIVDPESCRQVAGHRVGEVWVAGPSVARGYWQRPDATASTFGAYVANDGSGPFLRTGDLGFMRDGELFITGRLKDLIIVNGRNVYPQDIEEVIERSIDFIEPNMSAAFSVEIDGQERLAIVAEANRSLVRAAQQPVKDHASREDQLRAKDDYLARIESMAQHICKVIAQQFDVSVSSIVFVKPGTFPRTTSGKVQRSRCKELALLGQLELVYVMPGSIFDRRGSREGAPVARSLAAAQPASESAPAAAPLAANDAPDADAAAASRASADAMIAWFRDYAQRRLNSRLIDERRTVPPYVVLDLGNRGFFGLQAPQRCGGAELATVDLMRVLEQLAAVDLTIATLVGVHNGLGLRPILQFGAPAARERWLPSLAAGRQLAAFALTEPAAGSNPGAMQARAVRTAGGWRVSAEKQWIGLGAWAGVTTLFAKAVEANGAALGTIALMVPEDTPGLSQGPEALTMGMRGMVQNTVLLKDAFVPDDAVLGVAGDGMLVARDAMLFSRLGIGAMCVGALKRCAQLMARYAARREIGTGLLADNPVTINRLQRLNGAIYACEALVYAIAAQLDAGASVPAEAYLACKSVTTELLGQAADDLVQMLGGRGYIESNIAPQLLRDARVLRILEGPTETLYTHLGATLAQPGGATVAFIGGVLRHPELAAQLGATAKSSRIGALAGRRLFASEAAMTQWLDYRTGEVAAAAFLLAAAESRARSGSAAAQEAASNGIAWARQRYTALARALDAELATQPPYSASAALLRQVDNYADAIGDIEQQLPGEAQQLDAFLRHAPAAVAPAATPAPAFAAEAAQPAAPAAILALVHESVLAWLRSETRGSVPAIDFDTPFASIGIDSLASASIAVDLEQQTGMPIAPELLFDFQTVNTLAGYLASRMAVEETAST